MSFDRAFGQLALPFFSFPTIEPVGARALSRWPDTTTLARFGTSDAVRLADGSLRIQVDAPGLALGDFNIELGADSVLNVSGERNTETQQEDAEQEGVRRMWSERTSRSFSRSFQLPRGTTGEDISATAQDGVLTVAVRAVDTARPGSTRIQVTTPQTREAPQNA
jgi:HSP20 family molecular chaperone IbpA